LGCALLHAGVVKILFVIHGVFWRIAQGDLGAFCRALLLPPLKGQTAISGIIVN
jgi:hypothetical protein